MKCKYYICSLLKPERENIINKNINKFNFIKVIKSINGYDKKTTINEFHKMNMVYKSQTINTFGMLANAITKLKLIKYQINNNIPYICVLEDDLELCDNFIIFIENKLKLLDDNIYNMLRLDNWGEGYIFSLNGSKNIYNLFRSRGIIANIDDQLREYSGNELRIYDTPWILKVDTNKGDCMKTECISYEDKILLNKNNNYNNIIKNNNIINYFQKIIFKNRNITFLDNFNNDKII